jgi:hypothetical protein
MRLLSTLGVDGPAGRDGRLRHTARQGDKHQALRAVALDAGGLVFVDSDQLVAE